MNRTGRSGTSPFGVRDLLGNTYEWTATLYKGEGADLPSERRIYVLKGGSWISRGVIEISHRLIERGAYWSNTISFRCAV